MYSSFYLLFFFFFSLFRVGRFFLFLFLCCLCCFFLSFRTVFFAVFFFFSSRRRHTRCSRDWEFRRVLFRSRWRIGAGRVPPGARSASPTATSGRLTARWSRRCRWTARPAASTCTRSGARSTPASPCSRGTWRGRSSLPPCSG